MVAVDTPLPDAAGDVEDLHNGGWRSKMVLP